MTDKERQYEAALKPEDPRVQIFILADRVEKLTKEKEDLEHRLEKIEKAFDKGSGILLMLPIIGTAAAFIAANWKAIFKPWANP
jgi:hypothetical protein